MSDLGKVYVIMILYGVGATLFMIGSIVSDVMQYHQIESLKDRVEHLEKLAEKVAPYLETNQP